MKRLVVLGLTMGWSAVAAAGPAEVIKAAGGNAKVNGEGRVVSVGKLVPDPKMDEAFWEALAKEPLEDVNVVQADGRTMAGLGKLDAVKSLSLGGSPVIDDEDWRQVREMESLENLRIHHLQNFSGAGLMHLAGHPKLRVLDLTNNKPFDAANLRLLKELPALEQLEVYAARIGDEDFRALAGMPKLRMLGVSASADGLSGLVEAAATWPVEEIFLGFAPGKLGPITDAQVDGLARVKTLKKLRANNLGLTKAQHARLKSALPELEIELRRKDEHHGKSVEMEPVAE